MPRRPRIIHNARKTLRLVQLILQVVIKPGTEKVRPTFCCSGCGGAMSVISVYRQGPGSI
ncbi:MAG: hypothetical protein ABFR65_00590 [Pseudomonadota bacterium]